MGRIAALTRNPVMIALFMTLAVAGCASKKTPNSAADLGLGAAGSATLRRAPAPPTVPSPPTSAWLTSSSWRPARSDKRGSPTCSAPTARRRPRRPPRA